MDISNFVAAGTSYGAFFKAYQCQGEKGFFPYEHVRSLSQLEEPRLPPREAFHSWLRKSELSEEDYAICQRAWTEKGMRTLQDFLVWYSNLDVVPFLEGLDKMSQFWHRYGVDMLKEAISLPGPRLQIRNVLPQGAGLTPLQFSHRRPVAALQR